MFFQCRQTFARLQFCRKFGDFIQQFLPREFVALFFQQHDAQLVADIGRIGFVGEFVVLLADCFAAFGRGLRIAVFFDQFFDRCVEYCVCVVRRRARNRDSSLRLVLRNCNVARFEEEHRRKSMYLLLRIGRIGNGADVGMCGDALETECSCFHSSRIEQIAVPVEQIDLTFQSGHVAFDHILVFGCAAAQQECGGCENRQFFHLLVYLFLSSSTVLRSSRSSRAISGRILKIAAERWYCMPGRAG